MNGNLVPEDEIFPTAWNGVPVTIGHPELADGYTSANSPDIIEQWAVGTIFNSKWSEGKLKAEAWIDVERTETLRPGLIAQIESGDAMDVSTGYFSDDEPKKGKSNGRSYGAINRNLNPDHLALLPDETGACSWSDGCGIRANQKETPTMSNKLKEAWEIVSNALKLNTKPETKDVDTLVSELVTNSASPFGESDAEGLKQLSPETLSTMAETYVVNATEETEADKKKAKDKEEADAAAAAKEKEKPPVANKSTALPQTAEELQTLVSNAAAAAVTEALKTHSALSPEDKTALARAHQMAADDKAALVTKIVTNSKITKADAEAMDLATLTVIANGLTPVADFSGRGLPLNANAADKDDAAVKAMVGDTSVHPLDAAIKARQASRGVGNHTVN